MENLHALIANFLQCMCARQHENQLTTDKVKAEIKRVTFLLDYSVYLALTLATNLIVVIFGKSCVCRYVL